MPARIPLLIFLLPLAFAVVAWKVPPAVFSDCGFGFLVWQSMEEGAPFNHLRSPDPEDISKDKDTYFTWWSPGQYLLPGIFLNLGLDFGQAAVATVLLSMWLGLWGWVLVARKAGATLWAQTLFVIALATFRYSTLPFRMYNGGEILLFAAAPWALLVIWLSLGRGFWWGFGAALGSAMILFIAKLSGLIVFVVTVAGFCGAELWSRKKITAPMIGQAAGSLVALALVWWFWLSRGDTPAGQRAVSLDPAVFLFPPAAAGFSGLSLFDLLSRILLHPSRPLLSAQEFHIVYWFVAPLALALFFWIWRCLAGHRGPAFWLQAVGLTVFLQMLVLVALNARGSAVGFDERHLRYAGILVLLSACMAASRGGAWTRGVLATFVFAFGTYGVASFATGTWQAAKSGRLDAVSGLQQGVVAPSVLRYLAAQGNESAPPMVFLPSAEVGLALPGWRIDAIQLDFTPLAVVETQVRKGRVPELYVVLQARMEENGKADAVLNSFRDYQRGEWKRIALDGAVIYHAGAGSR